MTGGEPGAPLVVVAEEVRLAHRATAHTVRRAAANFYYPFLLLPPPKRRAIYALYGFCRRADDIADGPGTADERRRRLERFRGELTATLAGRPGSPAWLALADAAHRCRLTPSHLHTVIDGCAADCAPLAIQTLADLERYCYGVAGVVGLLSCEIFGSVRPRDPTVPALAVRLGFAMQLTNVLRDLREDALRDRCYLPAADLDRFGCTATQLAGPPLPGPAGEPARRLMRFELLRAREAFSASRPLFGRLPRDARGCPAALAAVYGRLLSAIEARGYDVQSTRVGLGRAARARVVASAWVGATVGR